MRALYEDARDADVRALRQRKRDFLQRFKGDGYYLIDALDTPMPKGASPSVKRRLVRESAESLTKKATRLSKPDTRVVLIGSAVYRELSGPLRNAGMNVINVEMIDFPASGRQRLFQTKLRPLLDEVLQSTIRGLVESVRYFGAGKTNQRARDRWVVEQFLLGLGLAFNPEEIDQPDDDPPDARFREASFEVKEVQDRGRRRGDEYKERLRKARAAESAADLIEQFTLHDITMSDVWDRLLEETALLAAKKYRGQAVRQGLDLLFYLNLSMEKAWGIIDGPRPDLGAMEEEGWRSVSFVRGGDGASTCCVLIASDESPEFLQAVRGRLIRPR